MISSALCWYSQPISITSRLMVAENMDSALRAFIISMMWRTSDVYKRQRSSRTVPYISKVTGVPMVDMAVRCCLGEKLTDKMCIRDRLWPL